MASATGFRLDNLPEFVRQLWKMVQNDSWNEIIKWNENGTGFLLCEEEKFPKEKDPKKKDPPEDTAEKESIEWRVVTSGILKSYFKHNSFGSFQKQLSNYSIHKNNDTKVYQHDLGYFNKNHPELLKNIIHKKKQKQVLAGLATVMSVDLTGAAENRNPTNLVDTRAFTDEVPSDLIDVNPGRFGSFETDLKDVIEVVKNNIDMENSKQTVSRRHETTQITCQIATIQDQNKLKVMGIGEDSILSPVDSITDMTPSLSIQEQNVEVPATITQTSERSETGYSSAGSLSQDQGLDQAQDNVVTNDVERNPPGPYTVHRSVPAARTCERFQIGYSSEEGSSSQDQEFGVTIDPNSGPCEGGKSFYLEFDRSLPDSVLSAWAYFGDNRTKVFKAHEEECTMFGKKIPPGNPGPVTVTIKTETGTYLGETIYTYEDPRKEKNEQSLLRKRKLDELLHLVNKMAKVSKQFEKGDDSEENGTQDFQQDRPNQEKEIQLQEILIPLVYVAAEEGAMELIETIFSLSAGRIVFESYKNESSLPEDIAEDNGHKETAAYLRGITKRYSEQECTSQEPSSDKDLRQIWEDDMSETGYSGDGETSSSSSGRESSDSDDEYKRIIVCKEMLEPKRTAGHLEGQYLGGGADCNSEYSNTEERKKIHKKRRKRINYNTGMNFSCCNASFDGPPCDPLEPLRNADLGDKIQGIPGQGNPVSVIYEESEVLLESPILYFEANSSCSSLLELQRTTSEDEELMVHTRKAGYFSTGETKNDSRYLGSVADCNSEDNNSREEEKEHETQHGNESYLEGESCCTGTDEPSCDLLELPGSNLEEKMQRTSHQDGLNPSHKMTEDDINDYKLQLPHGIGVKWKTLARALGYKNATIEAIEKEKGCSIVECCIELLVGWLGREGKDATAGRLAEALEKIGLKNLADNLISGFSCCRCSCTNQRRSEDAKDATNKCDNIICEMNGKLASLRKEVSRMSADIKELKEKLSIERQKCQETEQENQQLRAKLELEDTVEHKQEVSKINTTIEELEGQLSIAKQKCHETEQENQKLRARLEPEDAREYEHEENDSSRGTDPTDMENRIDNKLKRINEQLRTYVTSPLQVPEVKQDQLRTAVKLDLIIRLSERLQELYTETLGIVGETCKCSEDLRRDYYDLAYHGLRAEHYDLVHRVEDLGSAREEMSEEEIKEYERLQGYQKDRQRQVERLNKLWRRLFSPQPDCLHKTPVSEPTGNKPSGGKKKVTRHTDPGAKPKKQKLREEVTRPGAPSCSDDGKSDEESRLNLTKMKSAVGSMIQNISQRRKETGENQGSYVTYTLIRDS